MRKPYKIPFMLNRIFSRQRIAIQPAKTKGLKLVLGCLAVALFALPGRAQLSQISVKGNAFVNAEGKTVVFRGLDLSDPDKLSKNEHWNREYFEQAKAWGANIVRFPVHPEAWRSRGQANYIKLLDQGVAWATELGLYVIIDWHSIGNLRSEMFQNAGSPLYTPGLYETTKKETFEFWRTMSQHFKTNTTVACFELFNEPTTYNDELGTCTWPQWKEIMEELITLVRANGSKAVPLIAGFDWAYDLTPVATDPINAKGIAYVSHPYPMKRDKPWEAQWTADWGFVAEKYPVLLTEIGFCGEKDRGAHRPVISDESYGDAITAYCDQRGISYSVWVFDPDWAPMLFTDWNFTPSRQGAYFKKALQAKKP
jgi:endoglucanase